jgi:hypothetical protein
VHDPIVKRWKKLASRERMPASVGLQFGHFESVLHGLSVPQGRLDVKNLDNLACGSEASENTQFSDLIAQDIGVSFTLNPLN